MEGGGGGRFYGPCVILLLGDSSFYAEGKGAISTLFFHNQKESSMLYTYWTWPGPPLLEKKLVYPCTQKMEGFRRLFLLLLSAYNNSTQANMSLKTSPSLFFFFFFSVAIWLFPP